MGYSSNPQVLEERLDLLKELAAGHPTVWTCTPNRADTRRMVDRIREALYIASLYPRDYPQLAEAYNLFSIHNVAPGRIEARFKTQPIEVSVSRTDSSPEHGIVGPSAGFREVPQVALGSADALIASWRNHLPSSDKMLFTSTSLPVSELTKLYEWAQSNTPRLMILVGPGHITLSLYEAAVAEIAAWTPAPVPAAPEDFDV